MTFTQPEYIWFLAAVFTAYWALPSTRLQNVLLFVASAVFYGWVHPWFLGLLYFSSVLDWFCAQQIEDKPAQKRRWLALSLTGNLGLLAWFKYFDFFVANVRDALLAAGVETNLTTLGIFLPVGISFYTFQTMSYTIDVYRGQLQARRGLLDFLVYVSFFPQLVAGPIERATHLLPQVEKPRRFDAGLVAEGFGLALWGAFKKVCIADTIAPYVDQVHMLKEPPGPLVWAAVVAFGVQILADFSGYTDIARGSARMLGFELSKNFDRPYLATSTPDFWRRWHISLSTWIGDYVYVPLTRSGQASGLRVAMSLWLTFFLIGLWHGASWNFIALGLWHGTWMVLYTFGTPLVPRALRESTPALAVATVFHMIVVVGPGGLLFREVSIGRVIQHLSQPLFGGTTEQWMAAAVILAVSVVGAIPMILGSAIEALIPRLRATPLWLPLQTTWWSVAAVLIWMFHRVTSGDFIYFQF